MGEGHTLEHVPVLWLVARLLAAAILLLWRSQPVSWCTLANWEETKLVEKTEEQKSWFVCGEGYDARDETECEGGGGRFGRCCQSSHRDSKTAQRQILEHKDIIKPLRAGVQNTLALKQIRDSERQFSNLMHAVTRSESIDEQIEAWTKNLQRSEESLLSAQEAEVDQCQDSVTNAQLQLQKLTQTKVSQNASTLEPVEVLSQLAQAEPVRAQARIASLSLDKQTRLMENMLCVVLQSPGFSVPPVVLQQLLERQSSSLLSLFPLPCM